MLDPFAAFGYNIVKLIKQDGQVIDNIKALVQPKLIFVDDASICFEVGDIISRELPNGKTEYYEILDPAYFDAFGEMSAHYQIKVRKTTTPPKSSHYQTSNKNETASSQTPFIQINASDGSKVLVGSIDKSVNITSQDLSVFDKLIDAVKELQGSCEMIAKINQMKASVNDKKTFGQKYGEFIQLAAAHATLLSPLKPLISKLTDYLF